MNANKSANEKERLASLTTPLLKILEDMLHNRMNANKSANEKERLASLTTPPLETLEDLLHNRITQKKKEMHKTQHIADTERL